MSRAHPAILGLCYVSTASSLLQPPLPPLPLLDRGQRSHGPPLPPLTDRGLGRCDVERQARLEASDGAAAASRAGALTWRVRGFYPFPGEPPSGLFGWLFRDTHQAIAVTDAASPGERLLMDFMTAGGQSHPVWWDEAAKWRVLCGQSIDGEVRVRATGPPRSPKLAQLRAAALAHDPRMQLYGNNCRIFCARMAREAERLNAEGAEGAGAALAADGRLLLATLGSGALPALYPLGVLALCWEGLREL